MLKLTPLVFILGLSFTLFSQSLEIVKARTALEEQDYAKAKIHIDKGSAHEKSAKKASTWMLKGDIYYHILTSTNVSIQSLSDDAGRIALKSYQKALSIDTKVGKKSIESKCAIMNNHSLNRGVLFFNKTEYERAKSSFEASLEIADWIGKTDSLSLFNLGLTLERLTDYQGAIELFSRCVDLNFQRASSYENLVHCHQFKGDYEQAEVVASKALELYPKNNSFMTSLLNIHIVKDENEKALVVIDRLIEDNPGYAKYYSVKGSVLSNVNRPDEAILALEKGLQLDGESFDMNFNIGSLYFNNATAKMIESNNEDSFEKADELAQQANAHFEQAKKYLEKAHSINPNDIGTMDALKNVYAYTNDFENLNKMKEKLLNY